MSEIREIPGNMEDVERIFSTRTIRERAAQISALAEKGGTHFEIDVSQLDAVADLVKRTTLHLYPELEIPFHSRWGHFRAGKIDRVEELKGLFSALTPLERAQAKLDLVIVSVLLDAGAGTKWKYKEKETGQTFARSEGLGVASFRMFLEGAFSHDPKKPYQVTADGLEALTQDRLAKGMQVSWANPMDGFEGRFQLLKSLARALRAQPRIFGDTTPRPGGLASLFLRMAPDRRIPATQILRKIQEGLGPIWPGRVSMAGVNLGDVWVYPPLGTGAAGLVPFHKLSQWLTYSLIEPIEELGIEVRDTHFLTGLAEYRNGGLLVDGGLLNLRDPSLAEQTHAPGSELIVEWRALTVHWIEKVAVELRKKLGKTESQFPLGKVLEGGTWWAGRRIAEAKRPDGSPPLKLQSDGTVF
jgi:hypothetical protein